MRAGKVISAVAGAALAAGWIAWAVAARRPVVPRSTARAAHVFSTELPADMKEQAKRALERDAFRREERFLDAVRPGHLFASTRASEAEIEAGRFGPEEIFEIGAQLFHVTFTPEVGYGARDLPPLVRFQKGRRGGPDALRCAGCHWRGGPAGAGDAADDAYLDGDGNTQASALARNPIALAGDGLVELLAREITADLGRQRASLAAQARSRGAPARGELVSKGVSFGSLGVRPDGSVDASDLAGLDADLAIRPFGWKGNLASIRDAVEDSLLVHHGMQSDHLVRTAPKERIGPFAPRDPDGDGVTSEITEGQVTALTLFVAMQEVPQAVTPADPVLVGMLAEGMSRFESLGCARCHVPSMPLESPVFALPSRTGGAPVSVDLATSGAEPRLVPDAATGKWRVFLYSDLKRHDLGPRLAEPRPDRGVPGNQFLTRPLWGVARSRPYLHDGRAPTLEDAILLHGGEAQAARDAYEALDDRGRAPVRVFLTSLTRAKRLVTQ